MGQPQSFFKTCLTKRVEFNYHDTWYEQYEVNTNLVLPEYLEYLFLSDTISRSLLKLLPPKLHSEYVGPNDLDGHDLTEEEQYNHLVFNFQVSSNRRENKNLCNSKEIKKI